MPSGQVRLRVSRETRLLLVTILCSLGALLLLARLRFPERPATPNPVPPLLTQLAPRASFDDLSSAVFEAEAQILPAVATFETTDAVSTVPAGTHVSALRVREDAAVAWRAVDDDRSMRGVQLVGRDAATGLVVVRVAAIPMPLPPVWQPRRPQYPRYVLVTEAGPSGSLLRPVFLGALREVQSAAWGTAVWVASVDAAFSPGAFVFTMTGALIGLVVEHAGDRAIVPAAAVLDVAERLLTAPARERGVLGVEVQAMTPAIAAATGAPSGVIVAFVDPRGPAARALVATDVIERLGEDPIGSVEHWRARTSRLTAGETVAVQFRRGGRVAQASITTAAVSPMPTAPTRLGLTMRVRARMGSEVTHVDPDSVAAVAGVCVGDLITRIGDVGAPTPVQVRRAFDAKSNSAAVLVAIARGGEHLVLALWKR